MMKKIKNISKQSLTIALGIVLGTVVSIYASGLWHTPGGSSGFLQDAITKKRVLNLDDIQKIKDDLDYLKNNSLGKVIKFFDGTGCGQCPYGYIQYGSGDYYIRYCKIKDESGNIKGLKDKAAGVNYSCYAKSGSYGASNHNFGFWSY